MYIIMITVIILIVIIIRTERSEFVIETKRRDNKCDGLIGKRIKQL